MWHEWTVEIMVLLLIALGVRHIWRRGHYKGYGARKQAEDEKGARR